MIQSPFKLIVVLACLPFGLFAQKVSTGPQAADQFTNAELIRASKFSTLPSYIQFREGQQIEIDEFKPWMDKNFDFAPNMGFTLLRKETDMLGHVHYRYQQTLNDQPIEDAIWIAHTNADKIYSLNGLIYKEISPATSAGLSEAAALDKALQFVNASAYKWELEGEEEHLKWESGDQSATYYPKGELVFTSAHYTFKAQDYRLAYKFNVYAHTPVSRAEIYVDANTGEVIRHNEIIHHADEPGTAHTAYSGDREIIADSFEGEYRLRDGSRGDGVRTFDLNNATSHGGAVDFIDADNDWDNANPQLDEYATDAHWGAEMTYDYLLEVHGRNSIDNTGFQLNNYVHYGTNYFNAFWDGTRMTFGDGNGGSVTPLTSLDIAGHEVAHGLTTFTAGLIYYAESGALNESFSDIFGAAIERYARPDDYNWLLGEDIGTHFRNMANPNAKGDPDTYFGDYWADLGGGDSGGVHTNSGVQNFWFYLLTEGGTGTNDNGDAYDVTALGIDDASAIAFRNLTVYLTSSSDYSDARFYAIRSAEDIFGACTIEMEETANAWYAVGVGDVYDPTTIADFSTFDDFGCFVPYEVNFTNESFNAFTYDWDFGDGGTSTEESPTHVYLEAGTFTVTLTVDGGACGDDEITYVDFIEIDPDAECVVTLPPSGTMSTQAACEGTIFDSGGEFSDYGAGENAQVTIAPLGAVSVDLSFPFFDVEPGPGASCGYDYIEVYDGEDLLAPFIGRYCNTFPPSDITSTGDAITLFFHSDGGLELDGFEVTWACNPPDDVPETDFIINSEINCGGASYFTDLSTNIPIAWAWDFGDGATSSDQHPVHTYTAPGIYTVTLLATNLVGDNSEVKIDYVVVSYPDDPIAVGDTNCVDYTATLTATGLGTLKWYDAPSGGSLLFEGDTYITPALLTTTTYYVEDDLYDSPEYVGAVDTTFGTGDYYDGDQHLIFDNPYPAFLESVDVVAGSDGDRVIELRDNTGAVLETVTVFIPEGESTVILDLNIPIGTNMQLGTAVGDEPDLFRNDTGAPTYPYTIAESVEITGTSTGPDFYYFFYNWEVHPYNCASERVAVTAVVDTESDITIDPIDYICVQDEPIVLVASEEGGIWTSDCGPCLDEATGEFDPDAAGLGTWEIIYFVEGTCSHFNTIMIDVVDSDININPVDLVCIQDDPFLLTATDAGGTWSADCVGCIDEATGEFDPDAAGLGTWTISYSVPGTCSHYNTMTFDVVDSDIFINPAEDICEGDDPIVLTATEEGGIWSADCAGCIDEATGEFDPSVAGEGTWIVSYDVPGTCSHYNTIAINVIVSDIIINPIDDLCIQSGHMLITASESGGTWTADCGACIDPVSGDFDPSFMGEGTWTITYSVDGTCSHYNTATINVVDCLGLPTSEVYNISIYPNPSQGLITITTGHVEKGTILIKDVLGKNIAAVNFNSNKFTFDLNDFQARGTYFVEFYDENQNLMAVKKVLKQ
ncbi:MAG: PKD domain-containing protein [Crocinitomix sp.]|nr:PKD domain-containing protein [Crocinitomix sp.]